VVGSWVKIRRPLKAFLLQLLRYHVPLLRRAAVARKRLRKRTRLLLMLRLLLLVFRSLEVPFQNLARQRHLLGYFLWRSFRFNRLFLDLYDRLGSLSLHYSVRVFDLLLPFLLYLITGSFSRPRL